MAGNGEYGDGGIGAVRNLAGLTLAVMALRQKKQSSAN
jgi:hypothetical protein